MKSTTYIQQGDVLAFIVDKLPEGAKPIKGCTLALGESTGHHHTFYDDVTAVAEKSLNPYDLGSKNVHMFETESGERFAQILEPVFLKHQEHKPIEFKPNIYRIGIVREFDWVEQVVRKVID